MIKRSIVITNSYSLRLRNAQLVLTPTGDAGDATTIPIEDLGCVVVEHQHTLISIPLLTALAEAGVQVVFCNAKGMPAAMLQGYVGNNTQCETLQLQINIGEVMKKQLWKQIVEQKIRNQAALLNKLGRDGNLLRPYYLHVKSGDADNREGIAAKIYFPQLFGEDFVRDRNLEGVNSLLNYGYAILRAAVARALVSSGLHPGIGIFHHHRSNAFPLADDMMEPYRPFVDEIVCELALQHEMQLTKEVKSRLISVLNADVCFPAVNRPLSIGLSMSTASLVKCFHKTTNSLSLPILQ